MIVPPTSYLSLIMMGIFGYEIELHYIKRENNFAVKIFDCKHKFKITI